MCRNLQGSIQQIRVHNYGMKLKETASTEYRRIKNHWEVIQEFIMESNSSNSFSFSYKGRRGVLRSSNWESITTMQGRNKFCAEEWNGI